MPETNNEVQPLDIDVLFSMLRTYSENFARSSERATANTATYCGTRAGFASLSRDNVLTPKILRSDLCAIATLGKQIGDAARSIDAHWVKSPLSHDFE